ncbi:MAG: phytoene desaturase family protein [Sphingomonadales bacterium]
MSPEPFDVVIVGAGHNGLTCACYLASAGLKVKVVERRNVVGGAAVTEEFHPGFRNSVAAYAVSLLNPKVIRDLELHRHGLRIVERKTAMFFPLEGDRHLNLGWGIEAVQAEFARFSRHDAEIAPAYYDALERIADILRDLVLETPPNVGGGLMDFLKAAQLGNRMRKLGIEDQRLLLDLFTKSTADFLAQWFESPEVKAALAFDGVVGFYGSPYTPGSAYVLLHHAFGEVNGKKGVWGHALGGMGAITQAMARAAEERGVAIEVNAPVREIIIEAGAARGVVLDDGRVVRAKAVASNLNPRLLFQKMVAPDLLSADFKRRMDNWKCVSGTFRMNVALSELPDFTCMPGADVQDHHKSGIIIGPSLDYFDQAYMDARMYGWSRRPIIELMIPSTLDDSLAPPGFHVASLFCQQFSPELPDGAHWDANRDEAAETVIDAVSHFAPNFRDAIIARQAFTPLDLERTFGLLGGDIFHGALTLDQLFTARPMLGHADYRSPIGGLYMCGSGTHPGGGVTGLPGHNAAREIIRDFKRRRFKGGT